MEVAYQMTPIGVASHVLYIAQTKKNCTDVSSKAKGYFFSEMALS